MEKVNKRVHTRMKLRILVAIDDEDPKYYFIQDLSVGGMFIETNTPPKIGSTIKITLELPHSRDEYALAARVAWVRTEGEIGAGIAFDEIDEVTKNALNTAIERYSAIATSLS